MTQLLSYKNDKTIKADLIKRMTDHIKADELMQGATGQDGKGCTVWCALNNGDMSYGYNHSKFPDVLGLPEWLARVQDKIFEGLSVAEAKMFSIAWVKAIPVGVDLEKVKHKFALWVLRDGEYNARQYIAEHDTKRLAAFDKVCELLDRELAGDAPTNKEWSEAAAATSGSAAAAAAAAAYAYASAAAYAYAYAAAYAYAYAAAYYLASSKELLRLLRNTRGSR